MVKYIKGTAEDFKDIINFGNYVFDLDFKELLPKLYNGEKFIINVGDTITVEDTECVPDIKLEHLNAIKFLCDPLRIFMHEIPEVNRLIKS